MAKFNYKTIETGLIHGGIYGDQYTGAVNVPIYQTSTYEQQGLGQNKGWEYSRTGNPTRAALEALIAELEGGSHGFAFASGMAALTAVLSLFKSGDKIIISSNVYGGTFRVLDKIFKNFNISYSIEDTTDLEGLDKKITDDVKAILVETPANPLLTITDLEGIAKIAKKHGILSIVDNTFMTPYLQRPIEQGIDIVVHSATKYLGGHSDVVAGLAVVHNKELAERLAFIQNATGGVLGPFDSFLLIRGIKTLAVRMEAAQKNAVKIVEWLQKQKAVTKVIYPGLKEHPGYEIMKKQSRGFGAMVTFNVTDEELAKKILGSVHLIQYAESLGGVETLITYPTTQTHADVPEELRLKNGITTSTLRLSVGIENVDDLIADLEQAIN